MSSIPDLHDLITLFRRLGAPEPEQWASSQVREGIPQLARYLFLRQAWQHVVDEDDTQWIDRVVSQALEHPTEPYSGAGLALASLRAKGATDLELTELVRAMQAELLFSVCYLLQDPGDVEDDVSDIEWALVQVDANGNVLATIDGLHESVLETDPTGREMRPPPDFVKATAQ